MLEAGLTPPKDISSSQMYQQIIREITGGQQGSKASNKRGRGRCTNKNSDMLSPSKDSNAPRVRGRPRGSRNKAGAQRSRGKVGDAHRVSFICCILLYFIYVYTYFSIITGYNSLLLLEPPNRSINSLMDTLTHGAG